MEAILTGSQVYGSPNSESDIDLVVLTSPHQAELLTMLADKCQAVNKGGFSCRYGKMNLVVETSPAKFKIWKQGTAQLLSESPVTRDRAKEVFKALGLQDGSVKSK
jgi:hypothetical protein